MNYKIYVGSHDDPITTFDFDTTASQSGERIVDLISDELSVDNFSPVVHYVFHAKDALSDSSGDPCLDLSGDELYGFYNADPIDIDYGTPLFLYKVGTTETLEGRFYFEHIERPSRDSYEISAFSVIGLMDTQYHIGNIYKGIRYVDLIAEIFGGSVRPLENGKYQVSGGVEDVFVDESIAGIKSYGWLPYDTRRNNLHQLLFSTGTAMIRDADFNIYFTAPTNLTTTNIPNDRIFVGGSVKYDATATGVEITEHSYLLPATTELSTVFSNTAAYSEPADRTLVTFAEPIVPDSAETEGLFVHEIGANYAYVSGRGQLRAKEYTHLQRKLTKDSGKLPKNIKSYEGITLVSPLNSENVLNRLYQFNTAATVTSAAVKLDGEKPGAKYSFTDSNGNTATGILSKMEFNISSLVRADCEFICNYTPSIIGNNYNNSMLLTGSGTWTVPQTLRDSDFPYIRLSLIGGGSGGNGGAGGAQGKGTAYVDGEYSGYGGGAGGAGGKAGTGGLGGKVINLNRVNIANVNRIVYSCGAHGTKGAAGQGGQSLTDPIEAGTGTAGGESTLYLYDDSSTLVASYTTLTGEYLPSGVPDVLTDSIYALSGVDGVDGAKGGEGGAAAFGAVGGAGEDCGEYKGGSGSSCVFDYIQGTQLQALAGGGGGGGAAYLAKGSDSPNAAKAVANACCWGGDGGAGATPSKAPVNASSYGCGGDGGHGGGGGGTGGAQNWRPLGSGIRDGSPGSGGNGTDGADGADGCVFLYYS